MEGVLGKYRKGDEGNPSPVLVPQPPSPLGEGRVRGYIEVNFSLMANLIRSTVLL